MTCRAAPGRGSSTRSTSSRAPRTRRATRPKRPSGTGAGPRARALRRPGLVLVRHLEDLLAAELADHLGVALLDVRLDLRDELVVGLGLDVLAALAVNDLHARAGARGARGAQPRVRRGGRWRAAPWRPFWRRSLSIS